MRIPEVRKSLSALADDLRAGKSPESIARKLDILVTELWRRKPVHRPVKAIRTPITPELKKTIRAFAREHKAMDLQELGNHFNVNPGRVSEILAGFRR